MTINIFLIKTVDHQWLQCVFLKRTQGFAADLDYWKGEVFACVGLPQNLKDLKDLYWEAIM